MRCDDLFRLTDPNSSISQLASADERLLSTKTIRDCAGIDCSRTIPGKSLCFTNNNYQRIFQNYPQPIETSSNRYQSTEPPNRVTVTDAIVSTRYLVNIPIERISFQFPIGQSFIVVGTLSKCFSEKIKLFIRLIIIIIIYKIIT